MPRLEGVKVLDMKDGEVTRIEYEGEVYTKINGGQSDIFRKVEQTERKPKPGDLVKVSGNNAKHERRDVAGWGRNGQGLVPFGTIGKVTEVESEGIYVKFVGKVINTGGYEVEGDFYLEHGEYEPVTFYDKPAQIGDKILINEHAWGTQGKYAKGDVLTVKKVLSDGVVFVEENDRPILPSEFDIIERSGENESEIKTEKRPAKVGDKIRIVNAWLTDGKYENGDVLTVMRVDSNGDVWTTEELGRKLIEKSEYVVIIEENTPQFKAGDFAKVVGETFWGDIKKGTIVKITAEADEDDDIDFETIDGSESAYANAESLEKINPTNQELSFYRAGRNLGELKVGDIVRAIQHTGAHDKGVIVEITDSNQYKFGDIDGYLVEWEYFELVAPVENRTDIERSESDE